MSQPFKGTINIDIKDSTPDWAPYAQPVPPEGSPSALYVVLDDVGFAAMELFGGLVETPNVRRIADRGLTYTNFHTTALCSPTRSCLLTGRNHTTNGMACITEAASGFPNANGHIPGECAMFKYVYNWAGEFEQVVESTKPFPTGECVVSASFEKEGEGMPTEGTLSLFFGDEKVGEAPIKTQPGKFSLAGEGLNVGREGGEPVTDDYPGGWPWAFTGGTIHQATVDVAGEPWVDLEKELVAAFARD